jgi:tRNA modification GTPase
LDEKSFDMTGSTIYALASGKGRAGVSVVRVSGPAVKACIENLRIGLLHERKMKLCWLINPENGRRMDHAMAVFFMAPCSYTGEDVLELHVHGGNGVLRSVFEALEKGCGCRMAEPGEFTLRAFNNGKLELTQVEAIADLIDAESSSQVELALGQIGGALREVCEGWHLKLIRALAYLETCIDFSEEEVPEGLWKKAESHVSSVLGEIEGRLEDNNVGERVRDGFNVCVIGAPNVGKSTLVNTLMRREASIVSPIEGTTRDIIECQMLVGGTAVRLYDSAGLRANASDAIETEGIRRARGRAETADLVIGVFDYGSYPLMDAETKGLLREGSLIVVNKVDKAPQNWEPDESSGGADVIYTSFKSMVGLTELEVGLNKRIQQLAATGTSSIITRERHRVALEECAEGLRLSLMEEELSLIAENVRVALKGLGRVTGRVEVEEVLDVVFREFCIGK